MKRLAGALPDKMRIKGLPGDPIDLDRLELRKDEFDADWDRNLVHLLPQDSAVSFDDAWSEVMALAEQVNRRLVTPTEEG